MQLPQTMATESPLIVSVNVSMYHALPFGAIIVSYRKWPGEALQS
jgi:hypothetical protein